jgi:cytoskeleton protein RodZ
MSESGNPAASGPVDLSRPVLLRDARESVGLHIAALATALKVPVKKLEALEAGRYDELPDMTFARALASSACRHLRIDPTPILAQIPQGLSPMLGDPPRGTPFKDPKDIEAVDPKAWLRQPVLWFTAAMLAAAAVVLYMPSWDALVESAKEAYASTSTDMAETVVPAPVEVPASTVPSVSQAASAGLALASTASATMAPVSAVLLSIKGKGDASWVEVVDAAGVSEQRMLKPDEVMSFSAAPPYAVVLGRADAVEVQVRGEPFDVMPFARNSVARFQVK